VKILMLNAYYEPEIAASMYLLTNINEELAERGHQVDVYTPVTTRGVSDEIRKAYKKKKLENMCDGKLRIHRFSLPREKKSTIKRALRYLVLNLQLLWFGLTKKADLIFLYSTPPTNGLVAYILKKFRRIPIVYCIQDMFPESLVATGIATRDSKVYKVGAWVEKLTYKGANHFITISQGFKDEMVGKGVSPEKISIVRNWVDETAVKRIPREENRVLEKYNLPMDKFYVTYCGNIGFTQNIELILGTAEALKGYNDIQFLMFGEGAYKNEAEEFIVSNGLENVKIFPFQDYEYISDVFSIGDVGIIASKTGVGGCSVPSKTWSYMSAECAIVASFDRDTELVKVIEEAGCGKVCLPDDVEALKKGILELYLDRIMCVETGQRGRGYIIQNLTRKIGAGQYVDVVEQTLEEHNKARIK